MAANYAFSGAQTQNFGDFNLAARIGGEAVDMCQFAETMSISHGENESYLCKFVIKRFCPKSIDLYEWYAKKIEIDAVSAVRTVPLFRGIVDGIRHDLGKGRFELSCSDRREQQINALPHGTIAAIGYTSKSAHGDAFDTQKDELDKRLETVPASFEFDASGVPHLTPWKPKKEPDYVLGKCAIYVREPRLELASVGGVVNVVDVEVGLKFDRLLQRQLIYDFDTKLGVCDFTRYRTLPAPDTLKEASNEAGWTLDGLHLKRVPASGWFTCDGVKRGWIRDSVKLTNNEETGKTQSVTRVKNYDITAGTFAILKRWTQGITNIYKIRVQNTASIGRYQEGRDGVNFTIQATKPDDLDWGGDFGAHRDAAKFEENGDYLESAFYGVVSFTALQANIGGIPNNPNWHVLHKKGAADIGISGVTFKTASNGDIYADLTDNGGELSKTLLVAYHTAYTKILSSHRQNTLKLQVKFLPDLDLRHTHEIHHPYFTGNAKVSHFEHTFDFFTGLGETEIQYRFFQNAADNGEYTAFRQPENPKSDFPSYTKRFTLGRTDLKADDKLDDNVQGMIYRAYKVAATYKGLPPMDAVVFRINTPEIEQGSTDAKEQQSSSTFDVNVYNDNVRIFLCEQGD